REAVTAVTPPRLEREREIRARADRHADPAAARDRNGRPEGDDVRVEAVQQCPAACRELFRLVRGGEDRDRVTEAAQLVGDPGHMLVYIVWLRPRERRDEAKPHPDLA